MVFSYFLNYLAVKSRVVFNVITSSFCINEANINEVLLPVPEHPTNIIWPSPDKIFSIDTMQLID